MSQLLPGFRDFYPQDCAARNYIFSCFREVIRRFGFEEYDGPILEPLELFTAKSGPEIVGQLFNFADRGGRLVALRPEMTPTLARMIGAKAAALKRPIRWANVGENFRYERPQKGRLRSFYQMNADLFGEPSPMADAELINLLVTILRRFGLTAEDFHLRLSDRQLWSLFLGKYTTGEGQSAAALQIVDKIDREEAKTVIDQLEALFPGRGGELYDDIGRLRECRSLRALTDFFASWKRREVDARLADWATLLAALEAFDLMSFCSIDLAVVRGLAYYSGFVFEVFERQGRNRALAGGGRYDRLVWKLSGTDLPATGFAIGDVTLQDLLRKRSLLPTGRNAPKFYLIYEPAARRAAFRLVNRLRDLNISVLFGFDGNRSFSKQLHDAGRAGAAHALICGREETDRSEVTVKNLTDGSIGRLPWEEFFAQLDRF